MSFPSLIHSIVFTLYDMYLKVLYKFSPLDILRFYISLKISKFTCFRLGGVGMCFCLFYSLFALTLLMVKEMTIVDIWWTVWIFLTFNLH